MYNPVWVVKSVKAKSDYTLEIFFEDGEKKVYDARPLLQKPLYKKLNDVNYFLRARVFCGTVVWDDDTDIAPEHLYEYGRTIV